MLKIFEQIFGIGTKSARSYPEELVHRAIERTVEATDARIRILPGYERKLRPAVVHAIDSAVRLVDGLGPPLPLSAAEWGAQPVIGMLFGSQQSVLSLLAGDGACRDFIAATPQAQEPVTALLLAAFAQRQTFGYDTVDDRTVADVPLTVVSFDDHRLLGLATCEAQTRRQLQLRAFDYVLAQALARIADIREQRDDLQARKRLLQAKLAIVGRSSASLHDEPRQAERAGLQQKMNEVEVALAAMGADETVLQRNLAVVAETLAAAERQLWLEKQTLYIDHMHYRRSADHRQAIEMPLQLLRDAGAHTAVAQLVEIAPAALASRR